MAKKLILNDKKPLFGNKRSHALNASRKKWNVNLQKTTVVIDGKPTKVVASARTIKSLRKANS